MGVLSPDERRGATRLSLNEFPHVTGVTVAAEEVKIINASRSGILVEGQLRLNPGVDNAVEIQHSGLPIRMRGRVVRCELKRLSSLGPWYEIAIAFHQPAAVFEPVTSTLTPFELHDIDLAAFDPTLAANDW